MSKYKDTLEKVDKPITGEKYQVSWSNLGCTWICTQINMKTGWVKLKTPKTGKEIWAKLESLRKIKKHL